MKKRIRTRYGIAICLLVAFAWWTILVRFVDTRAIGPMESSVGFATLNGWVRDLVGVHMTLYMITDWLGLIPIATTLGFAIFGLIQWIRRKQLRKVDHSILLLGGFYVVVMVMYLLFEKITINYRPLLIDGCLEASYPSSTTMLVMCVMPTAAIQFWTRIQNLALRWCVTVAIASFVAFMIVGRLLSGVHWITDIIGGILLSTGLVTMYDALTEHT